MSDDFFVGQVLKLKEAAVVLTSNNDSLSSPWRLSEESIALVLNVSSTGQIIETLVEGKVQRWDKKSLVANSCLV